MNPYLAQARKPLLAYLGLEEIETVCTRIKCDCADLPEVVAWMRPRVDTRGGRPRIHNARKHQKAMDCIADPYKDDSQIVTSIPLKAPRVGDFDWLEIEVTYCEVPSA